MDPVLELHVGSGRIVIADGDDLGEEKVKSISSPAAAVADLCFLPNNYLNYHDDNSSCPNAIATAAATTTPYHNDGFDSEDDESIELQCDTLKRLVASEISSKFLTDATSTTPTSSSSGRWLGTALTNGEVLIWDLHQRKVVQNLLHSSKDGANDTPRRRKAALRLARLHESKDMLLLHTRDGIISRHDVSKHRVLNEYQATLTSTFCAAAPCVGDANLYVAPHVNGAVVLDWRQAPHQSVHNIELHRQVGHDRSLHGTVMSLTMLKHGLNTLVACGMEDGTIQLLDLRYDAPNLELLPHGEISVGKEPVLSMDVRTSKEPSVALLAAGMAGNVADLASEEASEQGRGVIVKVYEKDTSRMSARIRTRFKSWQQPGQTIASGVSTPEHWYKGNRAAISVCAFDDTAQIVAMGGWDYRVRLYHRSCVDGRPLALLRGHSNSITAVDWAPGSSLLATGSADGVIMLWDFPR